MKSPAPTKGAIRLRRLVMGLGVGLLGVLETPTPPAHAVPMLFDFNRLGDGASNREVQSYLQGILSAAHPGATLTVAGSRGENNYTGDDHVVGPVSTRADGRKKVSPWTLGNTDGGVFHNPHLDTFIRNNGSDRITMTFRFPTPMSNLQVSFDAEIFPDAACPKVSRSCPDTTDPDWPDFKFEINDVLQFRQPGILPGEQGTFEHSPISGASKKEKAPQALFVSGTWPVPDGLTTVKLEFIDWPVMIGIDNLRFDEMPPPQRVPEGGSLFLLGAGLTGLAAWRRRRGRAPRHARS